MPKRKPKTRFTTRTLASVNKDDEDVYTYPLEDELGRPWSQVGHALNPEAPAYDQPTGNATMRVRKTSHGFEIVEGDGETPGAADLDTGSPVAEEAGSLDAGATDQGDGHTAQKFVAGSDNVSNAV